MSCGRSWRIDGGRVLCGLFAALFLLPGLLSAQVIEVKDEEGNPVPAAVIRNDAGTARMTDLDGRLTLDSIIRRGDTLEIRSLGFGTRSMAMPHRELDVQVELSPSSVNLSEVVVATADVARHRMGAETVSRISARAIAQEVPANAATLLRESGQVMVQQSQQGGGSPILRGFEANRILLVVDGVRLNNAIYRSGHLQNAMTVDPFSVSAVEVQHGPGSVQFGSDALGGVIHYRTRSPGWKAGSRVRAQAGFGSASRSPLLHADAEVTGRRWATFTSVTHRRFGDLRMGRWRPHGYADWGLIPWVVESELVGQTVVDRADSNAVVHQQPGTGFNQTDVVQKVRFGSMERHVELNLQHSTSSNIPRFDRLNDAGSGGGPKWAQWDYGPQRRSLVSLRFRSRIEWLGNVTFTPYWQQIGESRLKARFGAQEREVQEEDVHVVGAQLDIDHRLGPWTVAYGAHWDHHRVRSEAWMENRVDGRRLETDVLTRYPNGGAEMGSASAYGGVFRRWNAWRFNAAARYTRGWLNARFDPLPGFPLPLPPTAFSPFTEVGYNRGALTGSGTVRWQGHHQWGAHAMLSSAFRNPNVDDVGKVRAKDGYVIVPADNLRPERLYSAEVGGFWRTRDHSITVQASGFSTLLEDAIQAVDTAFATEGGSLIETLVAEGDTNRIQVNANIGRATIRGVQGQAHFRGSDGWRFRATLNLTRGRDAEGRPLSHIPPAFGMVTASRSGEWLTLRSHLHWSGWKRLEDYGPGTTDNLAEATADGNPAWWTLGLDLDARLTERTTLNVGVHNVLDRHYKVFASGISAPGRDFRMGLRWRPAAG